MEEKRFVLDEEDIVDHRVRSKAWTKRILLFICGAAIALISFRASIYSSCLPVGLDWSQYFETDPLKAVLKGAPLIDTHNDFPIYIRYAYENDIYQPGFDNTSTLKGMVDFPRLQQGAVRGQFWSVYVGCPKDSGSYSNDTVYLPAVKETLQQIDLVHRLIARFPSNLRLALTSQDVWNQFHRSKLPIISSLLGAEGLHQIANSASIMRMYYSLGVRYITLTHFCHNIYADSCSQPPIHGGLSVAGVAMVQEMNRIGMMVDLSHVSADTMRSTLNVTRAPVIFSHSSAYSVCNHPRNVPDDVLLLLKRNRGVVQINFAPDYVNCEHPEEASLENVADHIEYIGKLIGYEHLGLGSDFDGIPFAPKGLEDVSKYPQLIKELLDRGVSVKKLHGLVGGNVLRVMKEVEDVADSMVDVEPLQDDVHWDWTDSLLQGKYR